MPDGHQLIGVLDDQATITTGPLAASGEIPLNCADYGIVALFVLAWLIAIAVWQFGRIGQRWSGAHTRMLGTFRKQLYLRMNREPVDVEQPVQVVALVRQALGE